MLVCIVHNTGSSARYKDPNWNLPSCHCSCGSSEWEKAHNLIKAGGVKGSRSYYKFQKEASSFGNVLQEFSTININLWLHVDIHREIIEA